MLLRNLRSPITIISFILLSTACINAMEKETNNDKKHNKVPFVYHPRFNISVGGLEKFHLFDTHKYAHIVERLKNHFGWKDEQFHKPEKATDQDLKEFHTPEYIDSLNQSWKELAIRAVGFFLFLALLSRFVHLGNHPIKLIILGIYALWGLRPFQAQAYSQGIADNPGLMIPFMLLPGPLLRYWNGACFKKST
jgi:hypothetical protein